MKNSDKSHELLKCYFNVIHSFVLACIYVYARCDEKSKKKNFFKFLLHFDINSYFGIIITKCLENNTFRFQKFHHQVLEELPTRGNV